MLCDSFVDWLRFPFRDFRTLFCCSFSDFALLHSRLEISALVERRRLGVGFCPPFAAVSLAGFRIVFRVARIATFVLARIGFTELACLSTRIDPRLLDSSGLVCQKQECCDVQSSCVVSVRFVGSDFRTSRE